MKTTQGKILSEKYKQHIKRINAPTKKEYNQNLKTEEEALRKAEKEALAEKMQIRKQWLIALGINLALIVLGLIASLMVDGKNRSAGSSVATIALMCVCLNFFAWKDNKEKNKKYLLIGALFLLVFVISLCYCFN